MSARHIDFLRPGATPWQGWAMLGLGTVALVASLWFRHHVAAERAQRAAEMRDRQAAQQQADDAAKRLPSLTSDQQRIARIAPLLRQPWLPTLRLIENATEAPVFLTGLVIDPGSGTVRISGEAPNFDQVLAYVRALNEPDLMTQAELRSHEQGTDPGGREIMRFNVVARWTLR